MDKIILVFEVLLFLIVFGCIVFIAYVFTRFIGNRTAGAMKSKNMQIIESISFGVDKALYLVKVGDKCFVISISGKTINYLTEVNIHDIDMTKNETEESDFYNILTKHLSFISKGKKKNETKKNNNENIKAQNTESVLLKNISRLKRTTQRFNNDNFIGDEKDNE